MVPFSFKNVCIESYSLVLPEKEVTSLELEEQIQPLYKKLNVPLGTLEKLSGVGARRLWDKFYPPSKAATESVIDAISKIGFDKEHIQVLFNCSVTRDYFEPATAVLVARNLGIREDAMVMDITNACIGFSNGMMTLATLIETGVVKAGVIVAAENITAILENSIKKLQDIDSLDRGQLLKILPVFTLGCASTAMVMCHKSIATKKHQILGAVARSATQHSDFCQGDGDYAMFQEGDEPNPLMYTDSAQLIPAAAKLGSRAWNDFTQHIGWTKDDVDHIFCHQIGKLVNNSFYQTLGDLDINKEFTVYKTLGNAVAASLPAAFFKGADEKGMKQGDKVLLTGFGSGLNAIFTAIQW